jgi:hypothetical protein
MTDPAKPKIPAAETNGQLIVALAIVLVFLVVALALVVAGVMTGKWDVLGGPIGTVIGALATALNAPSGIGNVLRANKAGEGA